MRALITILLVAFCSCNHTKNTKSDFKGDLDKSVEKPLSREENCDADFDIFFKKFQADSLFQITHTKFPIKYTYISDADDEYKIVRHDILKDKFYFVDFSEDKEAISRESARFSVEVTKNKDSVLYLRRGIDNGIREEVKFAFENGCWYLVEMNDHSM